MRTPFLKTLHARLLTAAASLSLVAAGCSGTGSSPGEDTPASLGTSRLAVTVTANLDCSGSLTRTMYLADTLTLTASAGCTVVQTAPSGILSTPDMVEGMTVPGGGFTVAPTSTGTKTFTFQNTAGTASETLTLTVLANPALPSAPAITAAVPGNGQVAISVSAAPQGTAPSTFVVTAAPGGATCTISSPTGSPLSGSCTVTSLTNRTEYTFTAVATSAYGNSRASNAVSAIPDVDADGDGLFSRFELALGTSDSDPDSDNDGLCDGNVGFSGTCWNGEDMNVNGVVDAWESDPMKVDTDGDGINDLVECDQNRFPVDTDGDGTFDFRDLDSDGDGISDADEGNVDTDGDGTPNYRDTDSDNDGTTDLEETGTADSDNDGVKDYLVGDEDGDELSREDEVFFGTNPNVADRPTAGTKGYLLPGWKVSRLVAVDHSAAGAQELTDYQVRFTFDTTGEIAAGRMKPDCSDLRVIEGNRCDSTDAKFWVADGTCNTNKTLVFVKYSHIGVNQKSFLGFYWGNRAAVKRSNGAATFPIFFEDFNTGATLDASRWNVYGNGTHSIVNGRLQNTGGAKAIWTKDTSIVQAGKTVFGVGTDAQGVNGADIEYGAANLDPAGTSAGWLHWNVNTGGWVNGQWVNKAGRTYTGVTWMSYDNAASFVGYGNSPGSCSVNIPYGDRWTNAPGDFTVFQTEFFYTVAADGKVTSGIYDKFGTKRSFTQGGGSCTAPLQNSAYWQFDHEKNGNTSQDPTTSLDYAYVRTYAAVDPVVIPGFFDPFGDEDRDGISNIIEMCTGNTDTDGDGILDYQDLDSDDDGQPDVTEQAEDFDGDGLYDARDDDTDNDGLLDKDEGFSDFDGDGIPNHKDLDSDNDGLLDADEGLADVDADNLPNAWDLDSDGDGLSDTLEGLTDTDQDGTKDFLDSDADNDGLHDSLENRGDNDNDGLVDWKDPDSDNDGTWDGPEAGFDPNGQALSNPSLTDVLDPDTDNDGLCDGPSSVTGVCTAGEDLDADGEWDMNTETSPMRLDSDGDGVNDAVELGWDGVAGSPVSIVPSIGNATDNRSLYPDFDGDGLCDGPATVGSVCIGGEDLDADGVVDATESDPAKPDTDGDGIGDLREYTDAADVDADTVPNFLDLDSDADGIPDAVELTVDTDGDGKPDYLDTDSDNDGWTDLVEGVAQTDADGVPDYRDTDSDNDGLADELETDGDADGDTVPNRLDTDSDNDGILDGAEAGFDLAGQLLSGASVTNGLDADSDDDGLCDGPADVQGTCVGGEDLNADGLRQLTETDPKNADSDFDGLTDLVERVPNALHPDTDRDGLCDGNKTVPTVCRAGEDLDGDGVVDATESDPRVADTDGDGIGDLREASDPADVDGDGIPNFRDLDSDDDGLPDAYEGTDDLDLDGLPDYLDADSDGDGMGDLAEASVDTDGDGIPDYRDPDGDNDGLPDVLEGRGDFDGDGIPDCLDLDSDDDGIPDGLEEGITSAGVNIPGATRTNRLNPDSDGDGLCDGSRSVPNVCAAGEDLNNDGLLAVGLETSPLSRDSDWDGVEDGVELGWDGTGLKAPADSLVTYGILQFTADHCRVVEHASLTGADLGGIALSGTQVLVNGQAATGAFDPESLASLGTTTVPHAGMLSDLSTQRIYVLADELGELSLQGLENGPVTRLLPLDAVGTVDAANALVLSAPIPLDAANDTHFVFSGAGFAVVTNGTSAYAIQLSSGDVVPLTLAAPLQGNRSESALQWGVAVRDGAELSLFFGKKDLDGHNVIAKVDAASGNEKVVSPPLGSNDALANITVDLVKGRWYWHLQQVADPVLLGGAQPVLEGLGACDLHVVPRNLNRALDADLDDDGLCDGAGTVAGVCIPGEDVDGDGVVDATESDGAVADTDGDGIGDKREQQDPADVDGDGVPNAVDTDSDNDGLLDSHEGTVDTDSDGFPDYLDTDSDNDGLSDALEGGTADTDQDGTPNFRDTDSDGDGILDATEGENTNGVAVDSDQDGTPDYLDTDSDNDGVPDRLEAPAGVKADGDNDGIPDFRDTDSDNDGLLDSDEAPLGIPVDTDGDGIPDFADVDSDNDGISDAHEAPGGVHVDTDGDGTPNHHDTDSDGDGLLDGLEAGDLLLSTLPVDTDGDGKPDYLDTDSDNDGCTDTQESNGAFPVDSDFDGTADYRDTDSDNDGLSDRIETNGNGTLQDTDGDGVPDFRDSDSDGDGVKDSVEGENANGVAVDTDGDGIPDYRDTDSDNDGLSDTIESPTGTKVDFDGDGIPDFRDTDSDNDGVSDTTETPGDPNRDLDGDGILDRFDLDTDGDGILDAVEAPGGLLLDTDGDGTPDAWDLDSDNDGISDALEAPNGTPVDTDGDGTPDYRDTDSDNDTIPDAEEVTDGKDVDTDGDGTADRLDTDSDNDGLTDEVEKNVDTDKDGIPDFRDLDSDDDGIPDEKDRDGDLQKDTDGDGTPDFKDADRNADGLNDGFRVEGGGCSSTGNLPGFGFTLLSLAGLLRRSRRSKVAAGVVAGLASTVGAGTAHAQEAINAKEGGFLAERYGATVDSAGFLGAEWGAVPKERWSAGLWYGFAKAPLQLVQVRDGLDVGRGYVVDVRQGGSLFASYRVLDRLVLALDLGFTAVQTRSAESLAASGFSPNAPAAYGVGDVRLAAKYGVLTQDRFGVDVSAQVAVGLPTAPKGTYFGNEVVVVEPVVAASRRFGNVRATANVGYRVRTAETQTTLRLGSELLYRLAAEYAFQNGLSLGLGWHGATSVLTPPSAGGGNGSVAQSPSEVLGGVTWNGGDLQLSAMAGAGVVRGYANPDWRALLQLRYLAPEKVQVARAEPTVLLDTDRDGIPDVADCAPLLAEDYNGVEDLDGAPDAVGTVDVVVAAQPENAGVVAGPNAKPGEHTVQVKQVAEAAAYSGEPISDGEKVRGGTLTLRANGRTWEVPVAEGATLEEVAEAVRKSGAPVVASVEKDGAGKRLSLVAAETGFDEKSGPDSALQVAESSTGTSGKPLGVGRVRAARNAEVLVDGRPVRSRSNRIEDKDSGVTLVAMKPGAEESFSLSPANEGSAAQLASSPSRFDAEVGRDAVAGTHAVQVMRLAQGPVFDGQDFETEASPVKAGTLTLTEGNRTWTVKHEDGTALSEVAKAVASSGAPADAEVVKDASGKVHLQVRARNAGTGFNVAETSTGSAGQAVAVKQTSAGTDSQWLVDGSSFTGRGNVLDDAIAGVVLRARGAGEAETLEVAQVAPPARAKVGKQPAAFAVVAEAGAHPGSYEAQVKQVAQPASWRSGKLGQAGAGTLVLEADGRAWKVPVAEGATTAQVAEAVAKSGAPVDVAVEADGDGQRVVVTAKQSGFDTEAGEASALSVAEVAAESGPGSGDSAKRVVGFQQAQAARNAVALVDGRTVQSRTNRIEDEVTGVVLLASAPSDKAESFEVLPASEGAATASGAGLTASRASGFTADVGAGAQAGKHSVQVTRLASAAVFESAPAASGSGPVKGGMLRITSGGETWEVGYPDGASLADVAKAVAASGAPVTTELAPGADGTVRLQLKGKAAGREVAVTENATGNTGMALAPVQVAGASGSEWVVNGKPFTGTGNRLEGAVAGVSLEATAVGEAETLELSPRSALPALTASRATGFTADVGEGAAAGKHSVQVTKLATAAVFESAPVASAAAPVKAGTLRIAAGGREWSIPVADGMALSDVAKAVIASGAPVDAKVVESAGGARLQLTGKVLGEPLTVAETSTGSTGTALLPQQVKVPSQSEWLVDGKAVTGQGNRLAGAIAGVSLTASSVGAAETLELSPRTAGPVLAASESSAYVAEVGAGAQEGQYPVQVMKLGGPAVYRSAVYATDTSPVAGGEFAIGVGGGKWRIAVPDGEPLSKVAAAVNASGAPVKARVVKAGKGYQLVIVTRVSGYDVKAGAASALSVKQTVTGKSGGPLAPTLVQAASNTEWVVDGKPYTSRTRRLHGAVAGVTLVAKKAGAVQPLVLAPRAKDGDKDGVADAQDACPGQPETVNGYMDGDGCPDVAPRIQFANGKFDLREQVRFETAKAVILEESNALLDEVARLLNEHPEVKVIRVEGHTDSRGARSYNINLSANRAKAVVDALVKRGVEKKRLQSQGFGPDKPLDTNDTDEGMARNRRTEFYVVQ